MSNFTIAMLYFAASFLWDEPFSFVFLSVGFMYLIFGLTDDDD